MAGDIQSTEEEVGGTFRSKSYSMMIETLLIMAFNRAMAAIQR